MNIVEELSKFHVDSKEHKFFENVLEKLGPNLVRKSVEGNLRETHNMLNKAIQRYFELHILANAVFKSAEEIERLQEGASVLCNKNELLSNTVGPLYLNYVKKYLPLEGMFERLSLFGLQQENALENDKSEAEAAQFIKVVEANIKDFCMKLIRCISFVDYSDCNWESAFKETMMHLESNAYLLSPDETNKQAKKELREAIKTYHEKLHKGVLLLSQLLSLHEKKLEFESNLADFHLHRCHALFYKIKLFELKVLEATYNQETIPALKKISDQLDTSEQTLKEDLNEKNVALEQYLKLGEEYEHFVDEYAELTKRIREQQWAIDEMKKRQSQYGDSNS